MHAMARALSAGTTLELSGDGLTLADAERLLHGQIESIGLASAARKKVERSRRVVMQLLESGETIYGVNTGFGKLSNQRIEPHEVLALQENLLRSHAVGMGPLLPLGVSRLALALRIQALAKGYSGVTPELIDRLDRHVQPRRRAGHPGAGQRRRQRRPGAAGPPGPRRHGRGPRLRPRSRRRRRCRGRATAEAALAAAPPSAASICKPYRPQAKEGLSLINGTQISTALLADALVRAWHLARIADVAGAMTVEATKSSRAAVRPAHPGRPAASRPGRLRRQPAPPAGRQRDHGVARRLRQGAGRLQHALHAAGPRHPPRRAAHSSPRSSSAR